MYRQKQRMILTAAAAIVPLVAACGSEKAGSDPGSGSVGVQRPVTGVDWSVDSFTADGATHRAKGKPYLAFDEKTGKVAGRLGCNHVNASATVRDGHITVGRPATTRMMCDTSLMQTERALLSLFNGKISYRVDADNLTLTSTNGTSVRAVAAK
jgi:heat shock protein HslJ